MLATLPALSPLTWGLLAAGALLVGVSKTAVPGINTLAIAAFAAVLPAKTSTGALLVLLIVGDILALLSYRRHADWPTLLRLIPAVLVGVAGGAAFLAFADDGVVRRFIALILLTVIGVTLWRRARPQSDLPVGSLARWGYGSLSGFTTMVANAGGPVMSMYFIAARFPVQAFLGTAAWFFAALNLTKLPISIGLGLITPATLSIDLFLLPAVLIGGLIGRRIALRINQRTFEWAVIVCTILGALYLLLP